MKTRLWGIGIVLCACAAAIACVTVPYRPIVVQPNTQDTTVADAPPEGGSDQPFYDDLSPYGRWVNVPGPGWVWSPYNVQAGWRPYQVGHWVFTDYGWTWASDEQWGSVVYHYGRWNMDPSYGWIWVPGTEWGPAWVAWHEGGGFVGWAPLPWQVRVQAGVGIDWAGINISLQPSSWCFVNARYLVDPGLRAQIMPASRNVSLIQVTRNVTNYTYIDNRVINGGVRIETINRAVGRTIPRYRVADADPREVARGGKVRGNEFLVARPDPSRGRGRGRDLPPGHDPEHFQRGYRQVGRQPDPAPVVTPPDPSQGQPANGQPGVTQPGQNPPPPVNAPPPPPARGRGNGFLDRMMRNQATRHAPQGGPPPQQAPSQPGNSGQPSNPGTPQGGPQQGNPPPGNGQGANSAPGNPAPPANSVPPPNQAQGQSANSNGRGHRGAPQRGPKPKQEAPKPDKPEQEKPKDDKGGSGN